MVTRMMTNTASGSDRIVAWSMIAGLALAVIQYAQDVALPAHFVCPAALPRFRPVRADERRRQDRLRAAPAAARRHGPRATASEGRR